MSEQSIRSYREAHNIVTRQWSPHIGRNETIVLLWILDRTYAFKKTWEVIPIRHFLEGVTSSENEIIAGPVHMSRRSVFRTLDMLKRKRLLQVTGAGNTHRHYEVMLDADPWKAVQDDRMEKFLSEEPEIPADPCQSGTPRCHGGTPECQPDTPIIYNIINTIKTKPGISNMRIKNRPSLREDRGLVENLLGVSRKTETAKQRKLDLNQFQALYRLFREQLHEQYPDAPVPPLTPLAQRMFRIAFLGVENVDPKNFIKYVVAEWGYVLNESFPKGYRAPRFPDLRFLAVHISKFTDLYARNEGISNPRARQGDQAGREAIEKRKDKRIAELETYVVQLEQAKARAEDEAQHYHGQLTGKRNARR